MHKPIGRGHFLGLTPLGLLARGTEINEIAHALLDGNQMWLANLGRGLEELRRHGDA
jgi:hypothetical protein